ncbi:MAG: hypothetical protein ACPG8V_04555 [Alphaproteobacteria bacterium]
MKIKNIALISSLALILAGCAERNRPDELSLVKYKPLVIPKKLVLVNPDDSKSSLGYADSRQIVSSINTDIGEDSSLDGSVLKAFKIKKSDSDIKQQLRNPQGSAVVVNIKKESERISNNIAKGKSLTEGETPMVNVRNTKSGVDELFSD